MITEDTPRETKERNNSRTSTSINTRTQDDVAGLARNGTISDSVKQTLLTHKRHRNKTWIMSQNNRNHDESKMATPKRIKRSANYIDTNYTNYENRTHRNVRAKRQSVESEVRKKELLRRMKLRVLNRMRYLYRPRTKVGRIHIFIF